MCRKGMVIIMCKLFNDNEVIIQKYCETNGLDFNKAKNSYKSWRKTEYVNILHYDENMGNGLGLLDETPLPVTLKIFNRGGHLEFEQTEHTATYLAM